MFQIQPIDFPFELKSEILLTITESLGQLLEPHFGIISVMVIDDARMQDLNTTYRKIEKTTDVLSFHYFEDFTDGKPDEVA